jgi:hypothetical protein
MAILQSVLASIFGVFGTKQPMPVHTSIQTKRNITTKPRLQPPGRLPSRRPSNPPFRTFSSPTTPMNVPDKEVGKPLLDEKQQRRRMLASHRRSRSIPLITLDYFGSTDDLLEYKNKENSQHHTLPVRKPLTFVIPPPPHRERSSRLPETGSDSETLGSRLANFFSKEKEERHKGKERRPLLSPVPASRDDAGRRRPRKPMRRISSAPGLTEESLSFYPSPC